MIEQKIPLTRENYIGLAYAGHEGVTPDGDGWTAEHEDGLPEPFRKPLGDAA